MSLTFINRAYLRLIYSLPRVYLLNNVLISTLVYLIAVRWMVISHNFIWHYSDVIMSAMASQITSLATVSSTVYSRRRSQKTSKLRVTGLCEWKPPVTGEFTIQMASNTENVSIWWCHHGFNHLSIWWSKFWFTCTLLFKKSWHILWCQQVVLKCGRKICKYACWIVGFSVWSSKIW